MATADSRPAELTRVEDVSWYHTLDLGGGVTTRGYVDTRDCPAQLPFPELTGKRCLDVGTMNGFWAFELERRGAASVTTIDVDDLDEVDWPPRQRLLGRAGYNPDDRLHAISGFQIAKRALGSEVERRPLNVYDLSPDLVGTFDFVFVGSILLHLRDPILALDRIRSVCRGEAVIFEAVDLAGTLLSPRRPRAMLDAEKVWYWMPNVAALRRMLESAGFDLIERSPLVYQSVGEGFARMSLRQAMRGGPGAVIGVTKGFPHLGWRVRPVA
jgi:tRNA (mo5U34)-methyltransferase